MSRSRIVLATIGVAVAVAGLGLGLLALWASHDFQYVFRESRSRAELVEASLEGVPESEGQMPARAKCRETAVDTWLCDLRYLGVREVCKGRVDTYDGSLEVGLRIPCRQERRLSISTRANPCRGDFRFRRDPKIPSHSASRCKPLNATRTRWKAWFYTQALKDDEFQGPDRLVAVCLFRVSRRKQTATGACRPRGR